MEELQSHGTTPVRAITSVFDTALRVIKHPLPQLLILLTFAILTALLVLIKGCPDALLGFGLLVGVLLIFGVLGFAYFFVEMKLRYAMETEEQLKVVIREKTATSLRAQNRGSAQKHLGQSAGQDLSDGKG
jgi:Na+/melibiose symporter-like transporter